MAVHEYEKYKTDYYTGVNIAVFFNGVWVDEAVMIEFNEEAKMLPIYSYNSYICNDLVVGQRLVTGSIVVNYTKSNYIDSIIKAHNISDSLTINKSQIVQNNNNINNISEFLSSVSESELDKYIKYMEESIWGAKMEYYDDPKVQNNKSIYNKQFDIVIKFNQNNPFSPNNSAIKIINAKLFANNFRTSADDNPLVMSYNFIAQTIVRN